MAARAARDLAEVTEAMCSSYASYLDCRMSAQLEKLKQCQTVLKSHHSKRPQQERSTQADTGPQINPLRHVTRLDHSAPFKFTPPDRKINWKRLRQLDLHAMAESSDPSAFMAPHLFEEVAHGDVEAGSIYDLSEANLIKLLQLAQLQLQYLQYRLEETVEAEQALEGDSLAVAAGLAALSPPSLGDLSRGLGQLGCTAEQLGSSRLDGLIEQVRDEERQAAKSALMVAIHKTKQQVDVKYGGGLPAEHEQQPAAEPPA